MARAKAARPKRRLPKFLLFLGFLAAIAVALVVILVFVLLKPGPVRPPGPPTTPPSTSRPTAQPASCPDVLTLVVPGTWESSADDDPHTPKANPRSLMLKVSKPLQKQFAESRTDVYTVPYTAQFRNPTNLADRQLDYNSSRKQGYQRAAAKMAKLNRECPLTRYVLMGFSQGAVIVGDLAYSIAAGRGPIAGSDQDLVLGVGLIADGRRQSGNQHDVGPSPKGVGAEVSLGGFGSLVPGITMTGGRGGFGVLEDRVFSICASGDMICDAPTVTNPLKAISQLSGALNSPVHAMYGTTRYWSSGGASATRWLYGWAVKRIDEAPTPEHY
ncbi:cutinase family protein [Gordonia amarae]|uniref:Cutinase n=2 Tax=Gordonia amarae TaxID=36821 RepID=G7GLL5_9ACTN|nr:cutinase family protein [Gordonia amarae]MCS3876578.1 hypothetical protein [Gordonia amarae]QHN19473.1 cutinase family protein [Gordonia amarae]QHN23949.1 cutinase family protein [Gordonia amarae]QHN32857.1 cutinase family protein [Gordonia amarae]QHN41576.1 cutinase family protein [Gordonia amarae]